MKISESIPDTIVINKKLKLHSYYASSFNFYTLVVYTEKSMIFRYIRVNENGEIKTEALKCI